MASLKPGLTLVDDARKKHARLRSPLRFCLQRIMKVTRRAGCNKRCCFLYRRHRAAMPMEETRKKRSCAKVVRAARLRD